MSYSSVPHQRRREYLVTIGYKHPEQVYWSTDHDDLDRVREDVRRWFNYLPEAPITVEPVPPCRRVPA